MTRQILAEMRTHGHPTGIYPTGGYFVAVVEGFEDAEGVFYEYIAIGLTGDLKFVSWSQ